MSRTLVGSHPRSQANARARHERCLWIRVSFFARGVPRVASVLPPHLPYFTPSFAPPRARAVLLHSRLQRSSDRRSAPLAPSQGVPGTAARVRGARLRRRQHRRHGRDARAVPQGDAADRPRRHARRLRPRRRRAVPRGVATHALSAPRRHRRAPGGLHRPARASARADQAIRGGADIVVAERPADAPTVPQPVRTLRRVAPWLVRPFVSVAGVRDPFGSLRLYRVSVIRDLIKERGDAPLLAGEGWAANVDLLAARGAARAPHRDRGARAALRRALARDARPRLDRRHAPAAVRARRARSERPRRARMTLASPTALARRSRSRSCSPRHAALAQDAARACPCRSASASASSTTCGSASSTSAAAHGSRRRCRTCAGARPGTPSSRCRAAPSSTASTTGTRAGSTRAPATRCASGRTSTRAAATSSATSRSFPSAPSTPRTARTRAAERAAIRSTTASFLYFLRTIPLDVGETYTFDRYFRPDRNPVTIKVLRTERIRVAGRRVRRHRRAADHQDQGHLLRERPRRGLAFGRREPHHAADEVEVCRSAPSTCTSNRTVQPRRRDERPTVAPDAGSALGEADLSAVRTVPVARAPEQGERRASSRSRPPTIARSPRSSRAPRRSRRARLPRRRRRHRRRGATRSAASSSCSADTS